MCANKAKWSLGNSNILLTINPEKKSWQCLIFRKIIAEYKKRVFEYRLFFAKEKVVPKRYNFHFGVAVATYGSPSRV